MGSASRQRDRILTVRLDDHEYAMIDAMADGLGVTRAEAARAILFGRGAATPVVPCSPAHPGCTSHHKELIDSYRDVRYREELALENSTGMHAGDIEFWRANGGRLTTFGDWLSSNRAQG